MNTLLFDERIIFGDERHYFLTNGCRNSVAIYSLEIPLSIYNDVRANFLIQRFLSAFEMTEYIT